jgi:hypothetical protein
MSLNLKRLPSQPKKARLVSAGDSASLVCSLDLTISALQVIALTHRSCGDARDRQLTPEIEDVCRQIEQAARLTRQRMMKGHKPKAE